MSKRVSLSASDCPTKRKARALTDYYPLKDKSADRLLEGGAQSDDDPDDDSEDQDNATSIASPSENPGPSSSTLSVLSGSVVSPPILDVGELVKSSSSEQLESTVHSLTNSQKYQYLTNHFKPSRGYRFPSTYMNKCNRSFRCLVSHGRGHISLQFKPPWATKGTNCSSPHANYYLICSWNPPYLNPGYTPVTHNKCIHFITIMQSPFHFLH